jgi:hypothetical protein
MERESKQRLGEIVMAVSFLMVVGPFFVAAIPTPIFVVIGFILFVIGAELYLRNRKHWNDI